MCIPSVNNRTDESQNKVCANLDEDKKLNIVSFQLKLKKTLWTAYYQSWEKNNTQHKVEGYFCLEYTYF